MKNHRSVSVRILSVSALLFAAQGVASAAWFGSNAKSTTTNAAAAATSTASATTAATNAAIEAVKSESTSLLGQITKSITQLTSQAKTSASSAASSANSGFATQLQQLLSGVQSGNDTQAAGTLQKLMAAKPTESQLNLLNEVRSDFALLALGRNFDTANAATQSSVASAITALKSGNTSNIVSSLQSLYNKGQLNDTQKQLVSGLVSSWNPKLAEAAGTAGKVLDAAKSFGF